MGYQRIRAVRAKAVGKLAYIERRDGDRNEGTERGTCNGVTGNRYSMPGASLQRSERMGLERSEVLHLAIVCDAMATARARYWASKVPRADPDESGGGYTVTAHSPRTLVREAVRAYRDMVESMRGERTASGGPRVLRGSRLDRSTG